MRLDVIIPTYNRRQLLEAALESVLRAEPPPDLTVEVTVADNDSTDGTDELVEGWRDRFGGRLHRVVVTRRGKSSALNAGIAATCGELVGMIDDDERVDPAWFRCIAEAFRDPGVDFIGGPYLPLWGAPPPAWLPLDYRGALAWVEPGDRIAPYGDGYPGILMGGNAVIRRPVLERVGAYSTDLGPTPDHRLMSCEDEDMYLRLLAAGARGMYRPDLVVHHYIPPERLTRHYFRRWCFWRGVSRGVLDRTQPASVVYLAGIPRYLFGKAARAAGRLATAPLRPRRESRRIFSDELTLWDLTGFFYGKHLYRRTRRRRDTRSPMAWERR
jgi:glucosyl-dolichyl phosphate glucuronosyltransferase